MSKEVIRPEQFCTTKNKQIVDNEDIALNKELSDQLGALYEGMFDTFKQGKIVTGNVVRIDSDGVLVDINYKSRGLIPKNEFGEHELKKLGQNESIEVLIDNLENPEGNVVLSYEKAKAAKAWTKIVEMYDKNEPVQGVVVNKVKGGLSVDIGVQAFLPGSQVDLQRVLDFDQYVGQTITASILKINPKRGNVIISRRKYLSEQREETRKEVLGKLQVNDVIQGVVKNITNYGVFIDVGGVDGLLHVTDMTWGRISHPSELVKLGDTITVKVLSFDQSNEKISLGLKQLSDDPWVDIEDKVQVGKRVVGTIASIVEYGLFVEIAPNIEGLVHISEVSWTDRINNLAEKFKVGQKVEVFIVSINKENRRISLSIKQLSLDPWETIDQKFKLGQKISGTISNMTDFGVFVQLVPGIDGLIHVSDLSWKEHIKDPRNHYHIGQEIEAIILTIDKESKKIALGIKQLERDPWSQVNEIYHVGNIVEGEVSKITNFGAFVKLQDGIEGLMHNSNLDEDKLAEDLFKVGTKRKFRIINISKEERKIALDIRLEEKITEDMITKEEAKSTSESTSTPPTPPVETKSSLQIALESAIGKQKTDEAKEEEKKETDKE